MPCEPSQLRACVLHTRCRWRKRASDELCNCSSSCRGASCPLMSVTATNPEEKRVSTFFGAVRVPRAHSDGIADAAHAHVHVHVHVHVNVRRACGLRAAHTEAPRSHVVDSGHLLHLCDEHLVQLWVAPHCD
eukprot:5827122-Prymnesium_polylepis.1